MGTPPYSRKCRDRHTPRLQYIVGRNFRDSVFGPSDPLHESPAFPLDCWLATRRPNSALNLLAHMRSLLCHGCCATRRDLPTAFSPAHLSPGRKGGCSSETCLLEALRPRLRRHVAFWSLSSILLSLVACGNEPSESKDVGDTVWQLAGTVTDSATGRPLSNVSVSPVDGFSGDLTDEAGRYYLLLGWACCYSIQYGKEAYASRIYDLCCNTCDSMRADTCVMNVVLVASQRSNADTASVPAMRK